MQAHPGSVQSVLSVGAILVGILVIILAIAGMTITDLICDYLEKKHDKH